MLNRLFLLSFSCAALLLFRPSLFAQDYGGLTQDYFQITGTAYARLGNSVAGGGDVNADGVPDFIVGASNYSEIVSFGGAAFVYSGADYSLLFTFTGVNAYDAFGHSVAIVKDVNGDWHDDILVGAPLVDASGLADSGVAYLFSGLDGSQLAAFSGGSVAQMGTQVAPAGDLDQDGVDDFLISSLRGGGGYQGDVLAISGATFNVLHQFIGWNSQDHYGTSIAAIPDVDGDGSPEVLVGAPQDSMYPASDTGYFTVHSGLTGVRLFYGYGISEGYLGNSVASFFDQNGDGINDFLVSSLDPIRAGSNSIYSVFEVRSGVDGSVLMNVAADDPVLGPLNLVNAGDANGDGVDDILVGVPQASTIGNFRGGAVQIYSGTDGALLYHRMGTSGAYYGSAVANLGDLLGDQSVVLAFGATHVYASLYTGAATLFGFHPLISASATELSQNSGGTIDYALDFPADAAGDTYQLLASTHGVGPVILPNGVLLPLSFDTLLAQTYMGSLPSVVLNGIGVLDANGDGLIQLSIPAGALPASMIGAEYHFAVACRYGPELWRYASIAVPLTFTP